MSGDISSICTLQEELSQLRNDVIGTAIIGDVNCHHARWLFHSSGVSTEGRALHRFCMSNGFQEFVKKPTREDYLLEVVLSDMGDVVSTRVFPPIADHNLVLFMSVFHLMSLHVLYAIVGIIVQLTGLVSTSFYPPLIFLLSTVLTLVLLLKDSQIFF